jgi:hypothetical protein
MTITPAKLTRAAGFSALLAGLLYMFVQIIHPHEDVTQVVTTGWAVTHILTLLMAVALAVGITGIYLRQVKEMGVLGLIGYLLYATWSVLVISWTFVEAFVLPELADEAPRYVNDALALFTGGEVGGSLGALTAINPISAVTYMFGGLIFGIAIYRAGILARWAALTLASGTFAALATVVLPHSLDRLAAFPVGIALVGLGYSLVREQRTVAGLSSARVDLAAAR